MNFHNHPMHAAFTTWFFTTLAGIRLENGIQERVILEPDVTVDLDYVHSFYRSAKGRIISNWERKDGGIMLTVHIPWNMEPSYAFPPGNRP
jgi:hypothetical protein